MADVKTTDSTTLDMLIPAVPDFTAQDFMSLRPYEWLYQHKDDKFVLQILLQQLKVKAGKVGVKAFVSVWNSYLESKQQQQGITVDRATQFDGQSIELYSGEYLCNDDGVTIKDRFGYDYVVCRHPILPVKRLTNIDDGEERMEIMYRKGKGKPWRSIVVQKSILASSTQILQLAAFGVSVTSENAKALSTYLFTMEEINYDTIPDQYSTSRLGWVLSKSFSPYVDDLAFDGEMYYKHIFNAVQPHGDRDTWVEAMRKVRAEKSIGRIFLAASFASVILEPCGLLPFFVHAWGGAGNGKAQPLDTKIITPDGYKLMGDIRIGDKVIGGDGKAHTVTGVYPQGKKEVFKITFGDGTSTRCCKEHLWNVTTRTRRQHHRGYTTMSLEEMMTRPIALGKKGYQYRVPVCEAVEYDVHNDIPVDPYLLGALIGDGCLTLKVNPANGSTSILFSNTERDVIDRVNACLNKHDSFLRRNTSTQCQYVVSGPGAKQLKQTITELGLNCKSANRFIPAMYLTASVEDRRALLAGLMDTDGFVGHSKHNVNYSTKSGRLAEDVQKLCRSLGYRATVHKFDPREEYTVTIFTDEDVFLSEKHGYHKKSLMRSHRQDKHSMPIISVEPCGVEECQCIMVDSDEHTYLCDDFIVTHNTVSLMIAASVWASPRMGEYIMTFNSTDVGQEMVASFLNSLPLCMDEMQIQAASGVTDYDRIIYKLCEGTGRLRGAKAGGIRETTRWRNCILTTGEDPIIRSNSMKGATIRVIEFECDKKVYSDLVGLCAIINDNYGFAGKEFVEYIQQDGMFERISDIQKQFYHQLLDDKNADAKQAGSASAILTADAIATELIFKDDNALTVKDIEAYMVAESEANSNSRALEYIYELISRNPMRFRPDSNGEWRGEVWGKFDGDYVYIVKSVFDREMQSAGYSSTAFLAWAKREGLLICDKDGRRTKKIRIDCSGGSSINAVCLMKDGDKKAIQEDMDAETFDLPF